MVVHQRFRGVRNTLCGRKVKSLDDAPVTEDGVTCKQCRAYIARTKKTKDG